MILKGIVPADARLGILPAKALSDTAPFHAGIVLVVEKDAADPDFRKVQWAAYQGIGHQKHQEWTLFLVAVGFSEADKEKTFALMEKRNIKRERVQWVSAAAGGVTAGNAGLDAAEAHALVVRDGGGGGGGASSLTEAAVAYRVVWAL